MKVQKSHLRLALFVLVVAILYNVYAFMRPAPRISAPQQPQSPLLGENVAPKSGTQIDPMAIRPPVDVDLARVPGYARDPFLFGDESREIVARVIGDQPEGPGPVVRSILFSTTRRFAIVDRKIVGVGDSVGGYKVVEIEQGAVVFRSAGGARVRVSVYGASSAGLTR
jgi:hypothetical protein